MPGKGRPFVRGVVTNPNGRPRLPEEIKHMKEDALEKAIVFFHSRISDPVFMSKIKPFEALAFLDSAFDRLGLPKSSKTELSGKVSTGISQEAIDEIRGLIDKYKRA